MNWDDLRFFLALAREGTVSGAGRTLTVKHTTVARRISALEGQLGSRLFDRLPSGYAMTQAAENLYHHALSMEEMPRHNHSGKQFHDGWGLADFAWSTDYGRLGTRDTGGQSVKDAAGNPLKDASGNFVFETKPHTNMPPYHTLYWIMFVGY